MTLTIMIIKIITKKIITKIMKMMNKMTIIIITTKMMKMMKMMNMHLVLWFRFVAEGIVSLTLLVFVGLLVWNCDNVYFF
jgi:hypothetical protein